MSMEIGVLQQRLGHTFRDAALLQEALTHPSIHAGNAPSRPDNERLEFLGDAVLQLAVTERLFELFPTTSEGRLTPWRATLVSRTQMARLGEEIGLGPLLAMSPGEERNQGRARSSNLANAMEAVIGAIFRDGGWEAARGAILRLLEPAFAQLAVQASLPEQAAALSTNAKGDLQEFLQREGGAPPRYVCLSEGGLAHDRVYEVAVEWNEVELGRGTGKTKQEAEVHAARAALQRLKSERPVS